MSASVSLIVELDASPACALFDSRLEIRGTVHNITAAVIDTDIIRSTLLVNGAASDGWSWAIANGLRDGREFALPPGEKVEFRRTFPSSSILPGPGRYELVLLVLGIRSTPVTIERF